MSKELPYFKFFPVEYMNGSITLEDYETQGFFINVCAYYWAKSCDVSCDELQKRFKTHKKMIQKLIKNDLIHEKNQKIVIEFLDEQLKENIERSEKNRENGLKGGRPQKRNESETKPTAFENESEKKPIREDKKREDKKREEAAPTIAEYGDKTSKYFVLINPPYLNSRKYRLWGVKGVEEFLEANSSQLNRKEHAEKFLREKHGVPFNDMGHLINSYNAFIDKQFK